MSEEFVKFESINMDRANDIIRRYPLNEYRVTRAEVILTNRCQLKCSYCQFQLAENCEEQAVKHEVLKRTISQWLDSGCRFLHFTGGEATLCKNLPEYVEMSKKMNAKVTLSTNGVNDISVYDELIRKGVNVFHISLDTMDPKVFDSQVGVEGSFEKVLKTIRYITHMRDDLHYDTKLVINTCITVKTFDSIVDIVRFMLSLKPNDMKLIPISQLKEEWEKYDERYEREIKAQLMEMIPEGEGFDMLRSRVRNLVKRSFRGYNNKRDVPPCYLSQDERTIDPEGNYYGCYINYREGAKPIGNIKEDSFLVQSQKLRSHMMNFTNSDICQKYCADITVMCNKYIDSKVQAAADNDYLKMGNVNVTRNLYGNKAYNLERLYEEGCNVPKACYLNSDFLDEIFIDKQSDYEELVGKLNAYNKNTGIRQWIIGQKTDEKLREICGEICGQIGAKQYAVRSSTNAEDANAKSYAGVFTSVLNVADTDSMIRAIKEVYASKYSYLVKEPEKVNMGIIIQEQVDAETAGVAFTANPVTGENEYVINYAKGSCEQIVSGRETKELCIRKDADSFTAEDIPSGAATKLLECLKKIEGIYGEPMDIEWVMRGGEIYILQARPITTVSKEKITGKTLYVDSLDREQLDKYDMTAIRKAHKKYMDKHYHIRRKALEEGLKFPHVGYLFYHKAELDDELFGRLVPDSAIYKVVSENEIRTMDKKDVVSYLLGLGDEENNIVRLQQITMTNACGNAGITEEGNVYIEYIPGGFGGFLSGRLPFSTYILDTKGNFLYKEELEYDEMWEFDETQRRFVCTEKKPFRYSLDGGVVRQLINMAVRTNRILKNPRVEWELDGDTVYLNDVSFEGNSITDDSIARKYLSAGKIEGEVRIIRDLDEIKTILKGRSIVPESEFYQAKRSDGLKSLLKKYQIEPEKKYVFISESAHPSLSLLMDHSAGFIFEKGGMLSHLGIILRENHVPGVLVENALQHYTTGQYIKGVNDFGN